MYTLLTHYVRCAFALVFAANLVIAVAWNGEAIAQTPADSSNPSVQELLRRMDQMQRELESLRLQNGEGQVSEASAPSTHADAQFASETNLSDWGGPYDEAGQKSACGKSGKCGCYPCQCGQCPAPCVDCPRVSTLNPYFNVHVFGQLKLDMLLSDARAVSPGTPYFLLPGSPTGLSQNTSDFHARQSNLGAAFTGPQIGNFQAGGMIQVFFYNDNALADAYGILPLQIWGDLKNENWRFAAGYQFDVFNPGVPTILPFSILCGSGNTGNASRGQVRLERFLHPSDASQVTVQLALSEPITTVFDPGFALSEDNGWPNVEGRLALGLGCVEATGQRPFEVGVSGIVGEIRNTRPAAPGDPVMLERFVTEVWGVGADFRWKINSMFGVMGELYTGQSLGTYNGAVQQIAYTDNDYAGIQSTGGWGEFFVYWTPCLHSHFGYGIDDPRDGDIPIGANTLLGRIENSTVYGNLIWDVTESFRLAFEVSQRETDYKNPIVPDNDGTFFHTQFTWSF